MIYAKLQRSMDVLNLSAFRAFHEGMNVCVSVDGKLSDPILIKMI